MSLAIRESIVRLGLVIVLSMTFYRTTFAQPPTTLPPPVPVPTEGAEIWVESPPPTPPPTPPATEEAKKAEAPESGFRSRYRHSLLSIVGEGNKAFDVIEWASR